MDKVETVKVYEKPRLFYLAGEKGWFQQTGHQVSVKGYKFAITNYEAVELRVSEVTTGMLFYKIKISINTLLETDTHEATMEFFKDKIGEIIKLQLEKTKGFKKMIDKEKKKTELRLGKKPRNKIFESLDDLGFYLEGMKGI